MTATPSASVSTPTVYVVDDDASIRELLTWLMGSVALPVKTFANAQSFLESYERGASGCLILDLYMPGMSGLDLQQYLLDQHVDLPVIFLSGRGDVPMAVAAVRQGAVDFIEKPFDYKIVLARVHEALARDAARRAAQGDSHERQKRLEQLTQREREVMDLVVSGKTNRVIADQLCISVKTVETHRAHVMEKLAVTSVAELVQLALGASPR